MQKTTTTETRTVVRQPAHLMITGYSITAQDPYGESDRQVLEIIGDGRDQIVEAIAHWAKSRHRVATTDSLAEKDLKRLAEAMGLEYVTATSEA